MTSDPATISRQEEIEAAFKDYKDKKERLGMAKQRLSAAECDFSNSRDRLGKAVCPDDILPNQEVLIWQKDMLLSVKKDGKGNYQIEARGVPERKR